MKLWQWIAVWLATPVVLVVAIAAMIFPVAAVYILAAVALAVSFWRMLRNKPSLF